MSERRIVIGLVGPSGSGKTTVANRLVEKWGFERIHTGIAVKRAVMAGFDLTEADVDGDARDAPSYELGEVMPRTVLEAVGEAIHKVAPEATALAWQRELARRGYPARVLADGIRRPAEAAAVKQTGCGVVFRISSPRNAINPDFPCDAMQAEVSADFLIDNRGTLDDLIAEIDRVVGYLLAPAEG